MILGIDTSLGTAVGIVDPDGAVRADRTSDNPLGHAEVIGDLLRDALADAARGPIGQTGAAEPVTLTHVAAGMGPGPFTGLRVGIAAARAFALARSLPVVAVPSHDAAALAVLLDDALADPYADTRRFAVVTDARRREVAYSVYEGMDADGLPIRAMGPALALRTDIDAVLSAQEAERVDVTAISAAMLAVVAARAVAAGRELTGAEPLYLRAPDVTLPKSIARPPVGGAS
ncbi:tRNA (adenosine(37)-N6)-threonylcarbamoyltransferase complex dimerization subunit type 1 TsaB [Microbacterium laevaniformans]|uniref:tRNA (adenosine(37)-N6)-threonylcarbamoyltransferase complex dimerization subunit type 1 TsaB n=1 Tax=Microbacterium laevaniformans TaxID=36807 RepID=UPI001D2CA409|nr:tRNA (adenosine(37)-N6)-threonylcarbamoyltransferase complex dimerization subunit type 1 TsaB [Microbacterium laevaniformans]MBM7751624.1 tRNA threonylcarbamoyl adenosine modification protein YeaZ [Microbacterium laevaniformans]GLJ63786.1 tRNA (adenosine(37)-N6)-threonylcarbamoyltransferase complex dimerization subunit type 1 TsaB [Microbacterium laevaniformans]